LLAAFTALAGPAWLAAAGRSTAPERLAGEVLTRGRGAVVSVGGLALALALTLSAGAALVRASPRRPRQASRAVTYALWAGAAWVMRYWLDNAR
ncbi:MAG: hypothetical protein HY909_08955, partial [Deltaproteobacteria bacterium]|nr:hypothetical protein [Deltaproteobacteria bacterium]